MNTVALNLEKHSRFGACRERRTAEAELYAGADKQNEQARCLLLIESARLKRECLRQALVSHPLGMEVVAVGSIKEWRDEEETHPSLGAILLNIGEQDVMENSVAEQIRELSSGFRSVPVVVLADSDNLEQILKALEYGARGFIPTSVDINVCIEAVALAMSGGTFIPASSVLAMRHLIDDGMQGTQHLYAMFTLREREVVEAIRRGKQNKIIAHELKMCESTVKVHIRNIMRKLKATNRTEVAYKLSKLLPC
ncbi:LuxR C-terminal-related transcriptional regulator [Chelativorans xinjiangense]|uniref:LuxR C-terminal-related transcriptional regulator n=1 Tax=Chelativorans xinjiangense TaxID=2681485 RepID=UPI001359D70A|nr:response regulator transcription factor [Chelativorans xinjiangense]